MTTSRQRLWVRWFLCAVCLGIAGAAVWLYHAWPDEAWAQTSSYIIQVFFAILGPVIVIGPLRRNRIRRELRAAREHRVREDMLS